MILSGRSDDVPDELIPSTPIHAFLPTPLTIRNPLTPPCHPSPLSPYLPSPSLLPKPLPLTLLSPLFVPTLNPLHPHSYPTACFWAHTGYVWCVVSRTTLSHAFGRATLLITFALVSLSQFCPRAV